MQINKGNFITWYNSTSYNSLPNLNTSNCQKPAVAWKVGENMSFVINGYGFSSVPSIINLCKLDKTVVQQVGQLNSYTDTDFTGSRGYATIECPNVPIGDYILALGTDYYSSSFLIINSENIFNTAKFKFRNKFNKNGVEYTNTAISTFYQEFRLFCSFNQANITTSKEIITDIDSSIPREYNTKLSLGYKCTAYGLDMDRHFAIADMITCTDLYINNDRYQSDGSISANQLGLSGLSNSTFNVQDYSLQYPKR